MPPRCQTVHLSAYRDSPAMLGLRDPVIVCSKPPGHKGDHVFLDPRTGVHVVWPAATGRTIARGFPPGVGTNPTNPWLFKAEPVKLALMPGDGAAEARLESMGGGGEACQECGSLATVRIGKCIRCLDCQASGECG